MNIILKSTNIELTPALREYTERRMASIEKFVGESGQAAVELEKTTNHHKSGEIFRAEVNVITSAGQQYRAETNKEDLYVAIDALRDAITSELSKGKAKNITRWRRGAQKLKSLITGINFKGFRR